MPSFEMLVQADPYRQGGGGPLLGATIYRDEPEELSDQQVIIEKEEETLLKTILGKFWIKFLFFSNNYSSILEFLIFSNNYSSF